MKNEHDVTRLNLTPITKRPFPSMRKKPWNRAKGKDKIILFDDLRPLISSLPSDDDLSGGEVRYYRAERGRSSDGAGENDNTGK